jgi:hypothetical protein
MAESDQRSTVVKALKKLDAVAVENPAYPGTPDVNYVEGWIELKWLRAWPARQDTVVTLKHYTNQQKIFAVRRRRAGGNCWLLLQVRNQWLLFDGAVAAIKLNKSTAKELHDAAHTVWPDGLNKEELLCCVSNDMKPYTFSADDFK